MHDALSGGIPSPQDCLNMVRNPAFRELEVYSEGFLHRHRELLAPYARKWVLDPLHQWSRQWEYAFMHAAIADMARAAPVRLLDAGCGLTFFPYFLLERYPGLEISSCDIDASLQELYERLSAHHPRHPAFGMADLTALPYPAESFDGLYCVSVLEHIPGRALAMKEFARVLRPGGRLIVSFDISLDGNRDISLEDAAIMIKELERYFDGTEQLGIPVQDEFNADDYFTTRDAVRLNCGKLPWTYPAVMYQIQALLKGKGWPAWPPLLTVSCAVLVKKELA